ncbi:MAG: SUMF1/EgtB/PvdO family nonheme iron enzyme [Pseudomonadota bacterium]
MQSTFALMLLLLAACDPGTEICGDGQDNDHDTLVDCADDDCADEDACTDADGDGVTADLDCDDAHANGPEVCDGVDNDCDGGVDEDPTDPATWYVDTDGDGYGNGSFSTEACDPPTGYVAEGTDCDDADGSVHPGAGELCAPGDEDCDGLEGDDDPDLADAPLWHMDYDGDGYGSAGVYDLEACEQPEGYVEDATDCDDADPSANPAGVEVCDGVDQDCDGTVDQGTECYDDDGDGQTEEEGDCDDADPAVYPGAVSDHEGIDMAYICPGTFTMGSPEDEVGRDDDETQHEVTLTRAFWLGVNEVTQDEFVEFAGDHEFYAGDCPECPAEMVSWDDAASFANAVSESSGFSEDDWCYVCTDGDCELRGDLVAPYDCVAYRLPTEAEWEYAARAGTTSAFSSDGDLMDADSDGDGVLDTNSCQDELPLSGGEYTLDQIAVYCSSDLMCADQVGTKAPNAWGLADMHGNVWEWCGDRWSDYSGIEPEVDPFGVSTAAERVRRGGSFYSTPYNLRSANRNFYLQSELFGALGLRLARTVPEAE